MLQYLKFFKIAIKIIPCLVGGYKDYNEAKNDEDVTIAEWAGIAERFIKCILSNFDIPLADKANLENIFNSSKYKIKLS
jgi:hypothetical protein